MTPEEALGKIYAMQESVANGWVPGPEHDFAFALIDMLDEYRLDAERYRWLRDHTFYGFSDAAVDTLRSSYEPADF